MAIEQVVKEGREWFTVKSINEKYNRAKKLAKAKGEELDYNPAAQYYAQLSQNPLIQDDEATLEVINGRYHEVSDSPPAEQEKHFGKAYTTDRADLIREVGSKLEETIGAIEENNLFALLLGRKAPSKKFEDGKFEGYRTGLHKDAYLAQQLIEEYKEIERSVVEGEKDEDKRDGALKEKLDKSKSFKEKIDNYVKTKREEIQEAINKGKLKSFVMDSFEYYLNYRPLAIPQRILQRAQKDVNELKEAINKDLLSTQNYVKAMYGVLEGEDKEEFALELGEVVTIQQIRKEEKKKQDEEEALLKKADEEERERSNVIQFSQRKNKAA